MTIWYDENNTRRGVLSADDYQEAVGNAVATLLFLASDGPATAAQVAAGVTGMTERRAELLLARLVTAGGATEDGGTFTGVLVEDAG
jgi:hypothetical protein